MNQWKMMIMQCRTLIKNPRLAAAHPLAGVTEQGQTRTWPVGRQEGGREGGGFEGKAPRVA